MAVDKTDGSGASAADRKTHWAWIGIRQKQVKGPNGWVNVPWDHRPGRGEQSRITAGKPTWVRVGSPRYVAIRQAGIKPVVVKAKNSRPANPPSMAQLGSQGGPGGTGPKGKEQRKRRNDWTRGIDGTPPKSGGGGGGKPPKNRNKNKGNNQTDLAIDQQLGGTNTGQKLGGGYADAQAGLQYDAPIHDLKTLIDRLGPQNKQAIQDLGNWFGSVQQLNERAGQRAGQITEHVADQQGQAVQGLLASLGGSANEGGQMIASQQEIDSGFQRALGGIEQQFHSDMDPILQHAEAQAKEREQRLNLTQMQDYQLQLADLMGQRGQAKAAATMEVDKYNNELAQQWFQNKLAKLNASLGAQAAGVDLKAKKAALAQQKKASGPPQWKSLNPAEKDDLLQRAIGGRITADGTLKPTRTYEQAQRWLNGVLKNPIGSNKNPGILTALFQYYH